MFYTVVVSMGRWSCLHLLRCFQLYETARHWLMLHGLGGWWQFCCLWLVISLFSMPVWTKFGREKYRREFASRYVIVQSMMVMRLHLPNLLHSVWWYRVWWWWDASSHPSAQYHGDETASSQPSASLWQHTPTLLNNFMVMRLHIPNLQPNSGSTLPPF